MKIRSLRSIAVVASAALLVGAFAASPAEARRRRRRAPAACAAYNPSTFGSGAPVATVTDAATKDAPVSATVSTEPGLGFSSEEGEGSEGELLSSHAYTNIQVDSASPSAVVNVQIEFAPEMDYDLHLRDVMGNSVEYSAGTFNVSAGSDHAHSDIGIESVLAVPTTDCTGYTVDVVGVTTAGGDVTVTAWLGE